MMKSARGSTHSACTLLGVLFLALAAVPASAVDPRDLCPGRRIRKPFGRLVHPRHPGHSDCDTRAWMGVLALGVGRVSATRQGGKPQSLFHATGRRCRRRTCIGP